MPTEDHPISYNSFEGTIPPGVDNPEVYKVRSGAIILPNGVPGIEATRDLCGTYLRTHIPLPRS